MTGSSGGVDAPVTTSSREIYANGALKAAQWVVTRKPGLYTMKDVLGLAG